MGLRRLIRTSTNHLGIAPIAAEPGDVVCVLGGSKVPFVMRKIEDHYVMIGECYVQGIMDGEVPRGDLGDRELVSFDIW